MSDNSASIKWNDLSGRTTDRHDGTPRFSLKGAKAYLYEYEGYSGGHEEMDQIIKLIESNRIRCDVSGADSPMNVANFEYEYHFDDGGFENYSGNYFVGPPGHGAFAVGFKAFCWLLGQLEIKQPRRFKNEFALTIGSCSQNEGNKTRGTTGIDNIALHKLVDEYIAKKEEKTQS